MKGEGSVLNIHDQALIEDSLMQLRSNKSTLAKSIRENSHNRKMQLCKIKSFGAGKKIRGTNFLSIRPDLIICDDIENDENIESKTQRDELYKWFNKALKPCLYCFISLCMYINALLCCMYSFICFA